MILLSLSKWHYSLLSALLLLPLVLPHSGCTRKQPDRFEQGHGVGLETIGSLDGKTFPLRTGGFIAKPNDTLSQSRTIDADFKGVNQLNLVSYKTDAKLLGDVPFRGKTHHDYEILYRLGEKYLKIYKVGAKHDIAYLERPYAETLSNGLLAVPLVGYKIEGYFRPERKKNSAGDDTNVIIEMKLPSSEGATHVRIDYNSREVFEALEKIDVYPSKLFHGDWYFSETVIDTSIKTKQQDVGTYSIFEGFTDSSAPTITFRSSEVDVTAVKVNYDPKVNSDNEVNDLEVLVIPVEQWVDYRSVPEGKDSGLKDEEVFDRPWDQRDYMRVRFDKVESNLISKAFSGSSGKTRLVDLEITTNFISFTLHQVDQRARIKYSFLRKSQRDYIAKHSFLRDRSTFGFFDSTQERLLTTEDHYRVDDFEQYRKLNRLNPNKDIVWHFSRNSPKYARPAAIEAVKRWNEAFKIAGYKHKMYVSDEDVSLGDIRYNVINLIDTVSVERLLGFGPSTKDPETGEIISATTNIYLNSFKAGYFQSLRLYIEEQAGIIQRQNLVDTFAPFGPVINKTLSLPTAMLPSNPSNSLSSTKVHFRSILSNLKNEEIPQVQVDDPATQKGLIGGTSPIKCQSAMQSSIVLDDFFAELPATCPEITDYIQQLSAANAADSAITALQDERQILESCYQKLLYQPLVATILHEMGHNFGLRHNFRASTDKDNFYEPQPDNNAAPASSSVMDYSARHAEELQRPGKYDIAAIRFGYFNTLETKDGEAVRINPDQSIAENEKRLGVKFRHYKFCTDGDVEMGTDPLCQRFDAGTTPLEIANNYIQDFLARFTNDRVRHNRVYSYSELSGNYDWNNGEALGEYFANRYFVPLKRLYDEWRFKLREKIGPAQRYLETYDYDSYVRLLTSFENEPWYQTYKPVADKVFKLFSDLAFLQARMCVVETNEGAPISIDFDIAQREAFSIWPNARIRNCDDIAKNTDYFGSRGLKLIAESGHPVNDFRFYDTLDSISGPVDVIGVEATRLIALYMIMQRNEARGASSLLHRHFDFEPNFLDEPIYRKSIEKRIVNRILNGTDIVANLDQGENQLILKDQKHFQTESDLLNYSLTLFLKGVQIPEKAFETEQRLTPYMAKYVREPKDRSEAIVSTIHNNQDLVAFERNLVAVMFISEFNRLKELRTSANVLPEDPAVYLEDIAQYVRDYAGELLDENGDGSYFAFFQFIGGFTNRLSEKPLANSLFSNVPENEELTQRISTQLIQTKQLIDKLTEAKASDEQIKNTLKEHKFETPVNSEDLNTGIEKTMAALIAFAEEIKSYEQNFNDYNAQMNILRRGFSALAN